MYGMSGAKEITNNCNFFLIHKTKKGALLPPFFLGGKMEITYDDFKKVQIKLGTVLSVEKNEKARKPSLVVKVDFGKDIGLSLIHI